MSYIAPPLETQHGFHISLEADSSLWELGAQELVNLYGDPNNEGLRITLKINGEPRRDIVYTFEGETMVISNLPCRYNQ